MQTLSSELKSRGEFEQNNISTVKEKFIYEILSIPA